MPADSTPSRPPRFDVVIFDLDGTLVDTRDGITATIRATLVQAGCRAPAPVEVYPLIGLPLGDVFRRFLPESVEIEDIDQLVAAYRALYRHTVIPATRPFPGVTETLGACRAAGLRLAVATSKLRHVALETLEAASLASHFVLVLGADSVARSKPAPDAARRILSELTIEPDRALVVGDAVYDVEMGRSAGVQTCAVTYGVQTRTELLAAEPDYLVDSIEEVLGVVGVAPIARARPSS